ASTSSRTRVRPRPGSGSRSSPSVADLPAAGFVSLPRSLAPAEGHRPDKLSYHPGGGPVARLAAIDRTRTEEWPDAGTSRTSSMGAVSLLTGLRLTPRSGVN